MPRFPQRSVSASELRPAVFTRLIPIIKQLEVPPIALHIGDTFVPPPAAAMLDQVVPKLPENAYLYSAPNGLPEVRSAFCERWTRLGLQGLDIDRVHVTNGATGGVSAALHAWVHPGDEVIVLSPFWPLVKGMIKGMGAVPVEVPFYPEMRAGRSVAEVVAPYITERTVALYVCSPNNPDGTVLSLSQIQELAALCVKHDLWVISDEAYVDYAFAPNKHHFIADQPGMRERTASVYTASKSYALAGIRIGFLVGEPAWLETARRVTTHCVYNVPMACQLSAKAAIETGDSWVEQTRDLYQQGAEAVAARLQANFYPAQGGGYVFVDLREELDGQPMLDYLADLLHEGVSISPGAAFGEAFETWVRVCYMSVPLDRLEQAIDRLNRSFDRLRRREPLRHDGPRTLTL